jgi:GTP-binding protein
LGEPGEVVVARLELKLLADIGLVGLPNAGKSTLISTISAAKPKIADYPFTTLAPNLGVVTVSDETFTVADMPGLIEGASEGHGLGHRFLKHVERCAALAHLVECSPLDGSDPIENFNLVERELKKYSPELEAKPRLVVLTKSDTVPNAADLVDSLSAASGRRVFPISAVTGSGLDELLYAMLELVQARASSPEPRVVRFQEQPKDSDAWDVVVESDGFALVGRQVARIVAMTNLESEEALRHLHRRLVRLGVIARLRDLGAEEGDTVRVGNLEFAYSEES